MSIGLLLKAELKGRGAGHLAETKGSAEELLQRMDLWVGEYCAALSPTTYIGIRDDKPTLYCRLHPAAEDLEISFVDEDHLTVSANTCTAGPGYHIFVCDMLHNLGKRFGAAWEAPTDEYCDETGYFHSGHQQQVFKEMTAWLEALAGSFFDGTFEAGDRGIRLAMSMDINFDWDAPAITPMGPRETDWLQKTAGDGSNGRDFFAWWTQGLNAEYFLGRALVRMWSDVRWRPPINDLERNALKYVVDSLKTAYKLDANLNYPWAEWAGILDLLEQPSAEYDFVYRNSQGREPLMGYRRHDVTVQLPGNWWIKIPGSFSDFLEEGDALCAQDPPRGIWYNGYGFTGDVEESFADWRSQMQNFEKDLFHETEDYVAAARINPGMESGQEYFALTSSNVCRVGRCICTIVFQRPEDREWAIGVWKSLQPPSRPTD